MPFVIVILLLWGGVQCVGQEERPQIVPEKHRSPENKKPKKGKEPRAVGILELNSSGKGTLVPIAILIDGKFYDASAYKADPVPMALESGTVYEAEEAGESQGLFTINGARHSKTANSNSNPWVGTGTYLPKGAEAPKTTRKAEDVPVGINSSGGDEPPRLTRKDAAKSREDSDSGSSGSRGSSGSGQSGPAEKPEGKSTSSSEPASGSSTASKPGQDSTKGADAPAGDKSAESSNPRPKVASPSTGTDNSAPSSPSGQMPPASSSDKASSDNYRPQLRRGKPTAPPPPDEEGTAGVTKPDGKGDSVGAATTTPLRIVAAISDAGGPDPQTYKVFWKTGEEEERRNQMLTLAADEVRAYAVALAKNQIPARPAAPRPASHAQKAQVKPAQPVLENVQFRGFDVWLTNQPVMILSAEARVAAAPGASAAASGPYSVMLVVRTDIYGNLRKLYSGVTDKFHLDVTPRLELIDVVDADADGRGELLFHETTDAGSGYVIYRATADKLWKMFDSLNAQ